MSLGNPVDDECMAYSLVADSPVSSLIWEKFSHIISKVSAGLSPIKTQNPEVFPSAGKGPKYVLHD